MQLEDVKKQVLQCTKCDLHKTKINYVFGEGDEKATIMFIGEAPGANEDKQGRPFIGRAGEVLNEILSSINLERSDIYIVTILKCRPPLNREPKENEILLCTTYLDKQIEIINPQIICCLGNYSTQYIFKKFGLVSQGISKVHGKIFKVSTIKGTLKIIPLYHPAMATYNPIMLKTMLEDIKVL